MAGTDHARNIPDAGPVPVIVLVAPQMGENIGGAARAMWNFGLDRLRLVAPRDGWPNSKAVAMASGAAPVLDHARVFDATSQACADLSFVFATTARGRSLEKTIMTPEQAMAEARGLIAAGERVGVLFGPERAGLEKADVVRANAVISVPVNPAFGSINLAQSVLLLSYEWMRQDGGPPETTLSGDGPLAAGGEVDQFLTRLTARLDDAGFFFPEERRASMVASLHNLFRRAPLSSGDVRTLHGVTRALAEMTGGRK